MFTELKKDVIGYKKIVNAKGMKFLVTLLIPKGTKIFSRGFYRGRIADQHRDDNSKLRAECAEILEIRRCKPLARTYYSNTTTPQLTDDICDKVVHKSRHAPDPYKYTKYEVGDLVIASNWSDQECECAGGIHFFVNKKRALRWMRW